jgi:hypothetical protein
MAERQGFEPWIEFPLYTLSKRAPSTTRPSLRFVDFALNAKAQDIRRFSAVPAAVPAAGESAATNGHVA